ncbi:MAG: HNH endonuclease signature motif containing protein [Nanoarchaeota archaeon]
MFVRLCKFCNNPFETDNKQKIFCKVLCQSRNYNQRPERKEKNKETTREWRRTHPEWRERHRILAVTRHRDKRAKYWKDYGRRPNVRLRINEKDRLRRKNDMKYAITERLRRSFYHALTKYSKTGKIASSKKYGIEWKEVIESLKPFPEDIKNFEIDHIIPLHTFDLTNHEEVKQAFSPLNLQWLTREENRKKSGKLM